MHPAPRAHAEALTRRIRCGIAAGVVLLPLVTPAITFVSIGDDASDWESEYPMGTVFEDRRTQVIYRVEELGGPVEIVSLRLYITTIPGEILQDWTIRMQHTSMDEFPVSPEWETNGWTVVFRADTGRIGLGWHTFDFTVPFRYNGTDNLLVDFSFNNDSWSSGGYCLGTWVQGQRSMSGTSDSQHGDPLGWAGANPPGVTEAVVPNLMLGVGCNELQIVEHPADRSVSLNAAAEFRVVACPPPVDYQWFHGDTPLPGATNDTLVVDRVQAEDAGGYTVHVSADDGYAVSAPATLDVDPTFTKVREDPLVTEEAIWRPAAWGDVDGDGYPDVFMHQHFGDLGPPPADVLFMNRGDGTFIRTQQADLRVSTPSGGLAVWDDYDNDGHPDLFVSNPGFPNVLVRNLGDGTFARVGLSAGEPTASNAGTWGDYDRDGYLDLAVGGGLDPFLIAGFHGRLRLYRNGGTGTLAEQSATELGAWPEALGIWYGPSWVDVDQDGWPDLFLSTSDREVDTNHMVHSSAQLLRNLGDGTFASVTNILNCDTYAWADYDNDGRLDLFGAALSFSLTNVLYHNDGDGTFRRMTQAQIGDLAVDTGFSQGASWGDYDNDGYQDLYVARGWVLYAATEDAAQPGLLYHNQRDGSFERVETGSLATEPSRSTSVAWVDVNRDGWLDLFTSEFGLIRYDQFVGNRLFLNNGGTNHWLAVQCRGTSSPRSGTGASVRVRAVIRGEPIWQLRVINFGTSFANGLRFLAHFGLGDAEVVETLRIDWPSGLVQVLHDVECDRYLTVTEPPRLTQAGPRIIAVSSWPGMPFRIQRTTDLTNESGWVTVGAVTNIAGTAEFQDSHAETHRLGIYRAAEE